MLSILFGMIFRNVSLSEAGVICEQPWPSWHDGKVASHCMLREKMDGSILVSTENVGEGIHKRWISSLGGTYKSFCIGKERGKSSQKNFLTLLTSSFISFQTFNLLMLISIYSFLKFHSVFSFDLTLYIQLSTNVL